MHDKLFTLASSQTTGLDSHHYHIYIGTLPHGSTGTYTATSLSALLTTQFLLCHYGYN